MTLIMIIIDAFKIYYNCQILKEWGSYMTNKPVISFHDWLAPSKATLEKLLFSFYFYWPSFSQSHLTRWIPWIKINYLNIIIIATMCCEKDVWPRLYRTTCATTNGILTMLSYVEDIIVLYSNAVWYNKTLDWIFR